MMGIGDTYQESSGILCVEAKNATSNVAGVGARWLENADVNAVTGLSMRSDSDANESNFRDAGDANAPVLTYDFAIETAGTYTFWYRYLATDDNDDSFHFRVDDGSWATVNDLALATNDYLWGNAERAGSKAITRTLSTGLHTLTIQMREDDMIIDRVLFALDANYDPSLIADGDGPAESSVVGDDSNDLPRRRRLLREFGVSA